MRKSFDRGGETISVMSKKEKDDMVSNYFSMKKKLGPIERKSISKPISINSKTIDV